MPGAEPSAPGGRRRLRRGTSEVDARWRHLPRRSARQCIVHRHLPEHIRQGQLRGGLGVVLADRIGAAAGRDRAEASLHVASVRTPADRGSACARRLQQSGRNDTPISYRRAWRTRRGRCAAPYAVGLVAFTERAKHVMLQPGGARDSGERSAFAESGPGRSRLPPAHLRPGTGVRKGVRMFRTTCRCDSSRRRRHCATRCGAVTGVAAITASPR